MDSLMLCLAIMLGLSGEQGRLPSANVVLPPLMSLVGVLGLAMATFCGLFLSVDQNCGGLYNPCLMMGKWTLVTILGASSTAMIVASGVLAWMRVRAR